MKQSILRTVAFAFSALMLAAAFACGSSTPKEDPKAVKSLAIGVKPTTTTYYEGDTFDPAGTRIDANLADGSVEEGVAFEYEATTPLTAKGYKVKFNYGGQTVVLNLDIIRAGNRPEYDLENTEPLANSPLAGKVYFFLGSSVTRGEHSDGQSMADFLAKRNGCTCIKEAVSGTPLLDNSDKSYVKRFDAFLASENCPEQLDAFICQLSTNDLKFADQFGEVTADDVRDTAAFDVTTTAGAMEYIVAKAQEKWDCPILFYTNSNFHNETYEKEIALMDAVIAKWQIGVIDLYRDEAFNNVTEAEKDLYMADNVHPTRAGYRDWWTPKFEEVLGGLQ